MRSILRRASERNRKEQGIIVNGLIKGNAPLVCAEHGHSTARKKCMNETVFRGKKKINISVQGIKIITREITIFVSVSASVPVGLQLSSIELSHVCFVRIARFCVRISQKQYNLTVRNLIGRHPRGKSGGNSFK